MRRIVLLTLACLLLFSSCVAEPPALEGEVISASVTEYCEPETTSPKEEEEEEESTPETEPETTPETEPEETRLEEIMATLPAPIILELSENLSEVYRSYTRKTLTVTEIVRDGDVTRSEISSEILMSDGNASFKRTSDSGDEEYYLIDGFLCYGGKFGNYRFGGYDISSFSKLAGNYFSLDAFEGGEVESIDGQLLLKFDKITDRGIAEITEMIGLPEDCIIEITKAEFLFVTDAAVHMKEKMLTLEATIKRGGEELLSFALTSHTEQSGINEETVLTLPAMTSYVLLPDIQSLAPYEAAIADIGTFWEDHKAFQLSVTDEIRIGGASNLHLTEKVDYAYAKKIGASIERTFTDGDSHTTRVLTHFNHRRGFSQINGGNIFVDTTIKSSNLESTLTDPFLSALLPFHYFGRIESSTDARIVFALGAEGKLALVREALLSAGLSPNSINVTSADRAIAYVNLDSDGKIASIGFAISAQVTADGKTYTVSRTHDLEVTKRGSAQVKVIYIVVDEEEDE